jgi:acyl-CoA reductase-like NAD-dependent aldehyde dehydrogenase
MSYQAPNKDLLPRSSVIIDGTPSAGSGILLPHIYPATGRPTGDIRLASLGEADAAVAAARRAAPGWRALPGDKRRDLMFKLAALIEQDGATLAHLSSVENGMAISNTAYLSYDAAQKFRYFGGWADKIQGRTISTWGGPAHDYVAYEPYGVIGAIIPWNGPLFAVTMVVAPALAAGNCIVVKAPEQAPYAVMRLGELFIAAGFPPGVFNLVTGGPDIGEAIVAHPGVDKIQFVGSGPTAKKVLRAAAETLKPCGLELGGKSAVIVFADADLPSAAKRGLSGAVSANGQGCVNGTRLLVERPIYEQYLAMLNGLAGHIKISDPLDQSTAVGPVISESALTRMLATIGRAKQEGGRVVTGGERMGGDAADGFFLPITIIADVANDSNLAQHEVFGPVLSVTPFDTEEEAIGLANGTAYGLGGYVHTQNLGRAHRMAAALESGMIHVNGSGEGMTPCAPFGGMKQSGYGRLGGEAGLHEFLRIKNVWMSLAKPQGI